MYRIGIGQDSHRFSEDPNKKLVLGGVEFSGYGFEGNSDGDVVIHALCNALEQAVGNGSLSRYSDPMCEKGIADSLEYLKVAMEHIREKGYKVNNAGISVEGKEPKIEPKIEMMKEKLCPVLEIEEDALGINATTGEGMTPFGKGEGVQSFAIVSLTKE
jgi:2-C-methyl-D-erythritol 2,4-cyclodiphosphate synthase